MNIPNVPNTSGIYVAKILSHTLMPVTRSSCYVDTCAKIDNRNVKLGKTESFSDRRKVYWKDFDKGNVIFVPLVEMENSKQAETAILRRLKQYRKRSPKNGLLEWLENIKVEMVIEEVYSVLANEGFTFNIINDNPSIYFENENENK